MFKCKFCDKTTKSIKGLINHYKRTHCFSREHIYEILHPNEGKHLCKNCGGEVKIHEWKLSYGDYCCKKCMMDYYFKNKSEKEKIDRAEKIKKSWNNRLNMSIENGYYVITHKDKLKNYLKKYIKNNIKPTILEIKNELGLKNTSTFLRYIHKYGFDNYIFWYKSLPEQGLYDYIKSIYKGEIIRNDRKILKGKELDIYIPEKNLAIEFNGCYWHSSNCVDEYYHQNKSLECMKKGIYLIHIYEDEWKYNNKIIKNLLCNILNDENKFFGGNYIIKNVSYDVYEKYCKKNILHDIKFPDTILGVWKGTKLCKILSFKKLSNSRYELLEEITSPKQPREKLFLLVFEYFLSNYNPNSIIVTTDLDKFDGMYKRCGFNIDDIEAPNMWFNKMANLKRLQQNNSNNDELNDLVMNKVIFKIYGAGKIKLRWDKSNY